MGRWEDGEDERLSNNPRSKSTSTVLVSKLLTDTLLVSPSGAPHITRYDTSPFSTESTLPSSFSTILRHWSDSVPRSCNRYHDCEAVIGSYLASGLSKGLVYVPTLRSQDLGLVP